jgi:hypothetical protein
MQRLLICLLILMLAAPAAALAQKKAEKPAPAVSAMPAPPTPAGGMCSMMGHGGGMMAGMMGGPEKWWHIGAMSQMLSEIMKKTSAILAPGTLNADRQNQLAGFLKELGELIPVMFYPKAEKPEEALKKLKDLEAVLEKLEAQARGK